MDDVTLDLLRQDPHQVLARLRANAPVVWVDALGGWVTTDHSTAVRVMRDAETFTVDDRRFVTERVVGRSMLSTDGAEHQHHRRPWAGAFRRSNAHDVEGWLRSETSRLLDLVGSDPIADLSRSLAGPIATGSMIRTLGLEGVDHPVLSEWYRTIVDAVTGLAAGGSVTTEAASAMEELRDCVHRSVRGTGWPAELADLGDDPASAVADTAVTLFGGIETGEGMITNLLWYALTTGWWARLVEDPGVRDAAIEESLRIEPAATRVDRYATRDVRLGSADAAAGDLVIVSLAAANRDPSVFEFPDRFDPGRTEPGRHLAFAHGPHLCIGRHLARTQTRVVLDALCDRFPTLRLGEDASAPEGLLFRKPRSLPVVW